MRRVRVHSDVAAEPAACPGEHLRLFLQRVGVLLHTAEREGDIGRRLGQARGEISQRVAGDEVVIAQHALDAAQRR